MNRQTQQARILEYLRTHTDGLTNVEAISKVGVARLSARIAELTNQGYIFERVRVETDGTFGKTHYTRYFLKGDKQNGSRF